MGDYQRTASPYQGGSGMAPGTYSTFKGVTQRIGAQPSGMFAPTGATGGGGGGGLQDIIKQMQAAQEKANLLNEQRYKQALGLFENLGKAGRARIEQQTTQRQAEATQSLISRGLGSTTVTSAAERGIASDAEIQRQQLEESVAMQKAGLIERRSDVGPDLGMFANLLQSAGQGQQMQQVPQQMTSRQMGPMAAAGKSVFGTPLGRFRGGIGTVSSAPQATVQSTPVRRDRQKPRVSEAVVRARMLKGATTFRPGGSPVPSAWTQRIGQSAGFNPRKSVPF